MDIKPPFYNESDSTIRISGRTTPLRAAQSAMNMVKSGKMPDFFYIGGNAGQQAMKAMSIFRYKFGHENEGISLSFCPIRVTSEVSEENGEIKQKDATVWRTVIIQKSDAEATEIC